MKHPLCFLITVMLFGFGTTFADSWVEFSDNTPLPPEITLLESDGSGVVYRVVVFGMWVKDIEGGKFQQLYIPEMTMDTAAGNPWLPEIAVRLGIPAGSSLDITVSAPRTFTLQNYHIAPIPRDSVDYSEASPRLVPIYLENSLIYSSAGVFPTEVYTERGSGTIITQNIAGVNVYPVRYYPAGDSLEISDTLFVEVKFEGGSGFPIQNIGIFNRALDGLLLNNTNPLPPDYIRGDGSVQWISASDTTAACDYLIVVPDTHWTNLPRNEGFDEEVERFATFRATISGFDVCMVRAATEPGITPPGAIPRGPRRFQNGDSAYVGIRKFIQSLYRNSSALHTGNGHLGFVLLIGDARDDDCPGVDTIRVDDWLLPTRRVGSNSLGDAIYGCMSGGLYQSVAVGRFPVGNPAELQTVVNKVIYRYCAAGDRSWMNNILTIGGRDSYNSHFCNNDCDANTFRDFVQVSFYRAASTLHEAGRYLYHAYGYDLTGGPCNMPEGREPYSDVSHELYHPCDESPATLLDTSFINQNLRNGVLLFQANTHGEENLRFDYDYYDPEYLFVGANPQIQNAERLHFTVEATCGSSWIDAEPSHRAWREGYTGYDACSEIALVKSSNGAIGWVGSGNHSTYLRYQTHHLFHAFSKWVVDENGFAGEGLIRCSGLLDLNSSRFHYMGDPALVLQPPIPAPVSIGTDTTWSGMVIVASNTLIESDVTLTLSPGSEIVILNDASLDVRGRIDAIGTAEDKIRIHGIIGQKLGRILLNTDGDSSWSAFNNCELYNLDKGIWSVSSNFIVDSVSITNTQHAIHQQSGESHIFGRNTLDSVFVQSGRMEFKPGSMNYFTLNSRLRSYGTLRAEGTSADSVYFRVSGSGTWRGIYDSTGILELDYASVVDAWGYCVYAESPSGQQQPVSIDHCFIDGSDVPNGGITLRLWNSPALTQAVSNSVIANAPAGNGLYLYNCNVDFDSVTVQNCDSINSYIKKVTGSFRNCTFEGRASYYSILTNTATCVPNFKCCLFKNLSPTTGTRIGTVFCGGGTAPTFGGIGYEYGVSNVFEDTSDYLLVIQGTGLLPVINYGGIISPADGGRNDWIQYKATGKFIQWRDCGTGQTLYNAQNQHWNPSPASTMFSPSTRFDYAGHQASPYGICGGADEGIPEEIAERRDDNARRSSARSSVNLDEAGAADLDSLVRAIYLEGIGEYSEAQCIFRSVAMSANDAGTRWLAVIHCVTTDVMLGGVSNWIPLLVDSLNSCENTYTSRLVSGRILSSYRLNRQEYSAAVDTCMNLLNSGLLFNDSVMVAIDLVGIQMAAGAYNPGSGSLDDAGMKAIPSCLLVTSDVQGLQLEGDLLRLDDRFGRERSSVPVPSQYQLYQNYPNPFNPKTEIKFDLPEAVKVQVKIFNTLGQEVATLVDGMYPAGTHSIIWDSKSASGVQVASGVYVYQVKAGNFVDSKKMVLIR